MNASKFQLGRLVATPNALEHIPGPEILTALQRHMIGDWGDVCADDLAANENALVSETRLFSVYQSAGGTKFWIITEADRSSTTVLLPEDY